MPEYNEAKVIAEELQVLVGLQLCAYELDNDQRYTNFDKLTLPTTLTNITTHGKKIIMEFDNFLMVIGLGMTGGFTYKQTKHIHLSLMFDMVTIYYDDTRKIGRINIIEKDKYCQVGVDLYDAISEDKWSLVLKPKLLKRAIRDILMDQKIISGIGNYLMNDILYHARIHPLRIGNTITDEELERIRVSTKYVVDASYIGNGLTIRDYKTPNEKKGTYDTLVYGKKVDSNCYQVIRQKVKGRSIHYVAELQKI